MWNSVCEVLKKHRVLCALSSPAACLFVVYTMSGTNCVS